MLPERAARAWTTPAMRRIPGRGALALRQGGGVVVNTTVWMPAPTDEACPRGVAGHPESTARVS